MSLSEDKINDIQYKKSLSFFGPLLLGIDTNERVCYQQFSSNNNVSNFNFNKSFIMFTDVQAYRHISIMGLMKDFNRNIKYEVLDLAMLLDIWYAKSNIISKDTLRTCDILILHGFNDTKNGSRKAEALEELISVRKHYNKHTWIFIQDTDSTEYEKSQPNVISNIGTSYQLKLLGRKNLGLVLSKAEALEDDNELTEINKVNKLNQKDHIV